MMKLAILLLFGVIAKQAYGDEPEAIVGGNIAAVGQFPHQCSLQMWGDHFCGGTIIDERTVITAAHCVEGGIRPSQVIVVTGTTEWKRGGSRHRVKCIRMHPNYTGREQEGYLHDIAVVTLEQPIIFNSNQKPVPLASKDYSLEKTRYVGLISGFGKIHVNSGSSPNLKWIDVNILPQSECLRSHGNPPTNPRQICTAGGRGRGACHGDSGGPLIINGELCGAVSWSMPCALGVPDVFTNVFYYKDFIKQCQQMCK